MYKNAKVQANSEKLIQGSLVHLRVSIRITKRTEKSAHKLRINAPMNKEPTNEKKLTIA